MALLDVPIVVIVCGEGGSGGALGHRDRRSRADAGIHASTASFRRKGCAAILWRDAKRKVEAAEALKITAPDLLGLGLVDEIVKEPPGGAHTSPEQAAALVDDALWRHLAELRRSARRRRAWTTRYQKFRAMGRLGQAFADDGPIEAPSPAEQSE